ncbi:TolC family protein [Comamonas sp. BIGb0124]|uniref:TolC family protein n=1 Tax=Comamonas sp. BIGb0124 TaxID=2485130 RepID=UPI0011CD460E|nr:TolC family protein [Comamonas sp. BIGb0124]
MPRWLGWSSRLPAHLLLCAGSMICVSAWADGSAPVGTEGAAVSAESTAPAASSAPVATPAVQGRTRVVLVRRAQSEPAAGVAEPSAVTPAPVVVSDAMPAGQTSLLAQAAPTTATVPVVPVAPVAPAATASPTLAAPATPAAAAPVTEPLPATATPAVPATGSASTAPAAPLQSTRQLSPQSQGSVAYTRQIKEALVDALSTHPDVLTALSELETSSYEVEAARQQRFPRFKVGTSVGNTDAGTASGSQSYNALSADARITVLDGGSIGARVDAAKAGNQAIDEAYVSARQQVLLDSLTAYLQVQRFDLKRKVADRSSAVLDEIARVEERRVDLGASGRSDYQMTLARRASSAARQSEFESKRIDALAKFESYFGFQPNAEYMPATTTPSQWSLATLEDALQAASNNSVELREAQLLIDQAKAGVREAEGGRWPTLDAVVAKTKDKDRVVYSDGTRVGVEVNWNFGTGFELQRKVKVALAKQSAQEAKYESVRRNVQQQTFAVWGQTSAMREREARLREAADAAREVFEGRRRLMEFGRETLPQVLDAQIDYYTALQDYVDAVYDTRINDLRLARTTGYLDMLPGQPADWLDSYFTGQDLVGLSALMARAEVPSCADAAPGACPAAPVAGAAAPAAGPRNPAANGNGSKKVSAQAQSAGKKAQSASSPTAVAATQTASAP